MDVIICVSHVDMCKNLTKLSLNFLKITLTMKVRGLIFFNKQALKVGLTTCIKLPYLNSWMNHSGGGWKTPLPPAYAVQEIVHRVNGENSCTQA